VTTRAKLVGLAFATAAVWLAAALLLVNAMTGATWSCASPPLGAIATAPPSCDRAGVR
jgi:hypothetical protein